MIISNVPGPRQPLYFSGAQLEQYIPVSTIAEGMGLNITVHSYLDEMTWGLIACRELVPDLWDMTDLHIAEIDRLFEATGAEWAVPPRPAPPAAGPVVIRQAARRRAARRRHERRQSRGQGGPPSAPRPAARPRHRRAKAAASARRAGAKKSTARRGAAKRSARARPSVPLDDPPRPPTVARLATAGGGGLAVRGRRVLGRPAGAARTRPGRRPPGADAAGVRGQ